MNERHQSARAQQKRNDVLDAALRLIARDGIRAVTHRAVAAELGSSLRATTYYFESIDELIESAFVRYFDRSLARFAEVESAISAQAPSIREAAMALAAVVASDLHVDRDGLIAEYSVVLEISRRPALEAVYVDWQAALERWLRTYANSLGAAQPEIAARITLATLRGLEMEALARPSRIFDFDETAEIFAQLLAGLTRRTESNESGDETSPGSQ